MDHLRGLSSLIEIRILGHSFGLNNIQENGLIMNPVFFFYPTDNGAARFFVNRLDNGTAACRTFDLNY